MPKILLSLFMILFAFSASAGRDFSAALKATFDDFQYTTSVEWDQKDSKFFEDQVSKLQASMTELQKEGLTEQDVRLFLASISKGSLNVEETKLKLATLNLQNLRSIELAKIITATVQTNYQKGASWSSEGLTEGAEFVGVLALMFGFWYVAAGLAG